MLVRCLVCWMVRSVLIPARVLYGIGSVCCGGILLTDLWNLLGLVGCWIWLVMGPLGTGRCTFWLIVLLV